MSSLFSISCTTFRESPRCGGLTVSDRARPFRTSNRSGSTHFLRHDICNACFDHGDHGTEDDRMFLRVGRDGLTSRLDGRRGCSCFGRSGHCFPHDVRGVGRFPAHDQSTCERACRRACRHCSCWCGAHVRLGRLYAVLVSRFPSVRSPIPAEDRTLPPSSSTASVGSGGWWVSFERVGENASNPSGMASLLPPPLPLFPFDSLHRGPPSFSDVGREGEHGVRRGLRFSHRGEEKGTSHPFPHLLPSIPAGLPRRMGIPNERRTSNHGRTERQPRSPFDTHRHNQVRFTKETTTRIQGGMNRPYESMPCNAHPSYATTLDQQGCKTKNRMRVQSGFQRHAPRQPVVPQTTRDVHVIRPTYAENDARSRPCTWAIGCVKGNGCKDLKDTSTLCPYCTLVTTRAEPSRSDSIAPSACPTMEGDGSP